MSSPYLLSLLITCGQPAHAGVGDHHTTVSPLFFIAYPQTRVPVPSMLGPYNDASGAGQPMLSNCSLLKELPPVPQVHGPLLNLEIPNLDPGILL